jgi:hypothetical protein
MSVKTRCVRRDPSNKRKPWEAILHIYNVGEAHIPRIYRDPAMSRAAMHQTSGELEEPEESTCPWCPYTGTLKQLTRHMESAHYLRWCDLALYPPIAGERY